MHTRSPSLKIDWMNDDEYASDDSNSEASDSETQQQLIHKHAKLHDTKDLTQYLKQLYGESVTLHGV